MLIYILLLLLIASFTVHIIIILVYVKTKSKVMFSWFIATVLTNMGIAISLSIAALTNPDMVRKINLKFFMWLLTGFITFLMIGIQFNIFRKIYKRSKDPQWYHLNYFGKKVYEQGIVQQTEFLTFVISFPFLLFVGAYFVARLINFIRFGTI